VDDAHGDNEALALSKLDTSILEVDDETAFKNKEELVVAFVFVPMVLALHDAETDDRIVHLAQCLVVPAVGTRLHQRGHVNQL
jgi:hypothetical protein